MAGWLGSYGGEDSPDDISRGLFAGEVGSPRLLTLFERFGIMTNWFTLGHSIETFPKEMQAVADAGHEIGIEDHRSRLVFIVEGLEPDPIRRSFAVFNRLDIGVAA